MKKHLETALAREMQVRLNRPRASNVAPKRS